MAEYAYPLVLTIAGSDSGAGAGIQADLKTFAALGCYGATAITAVTVQNTLGVAAIHGIPTDILSGQILAILDDMRPLAIKIGLIANTAQVAAIADLLSRFPQLPIILDPVVKASTGAGLAQDGTLAAIKERLFPLATLVTPNLYEATLLINSPVNDLSSMQYAAQELLGAGCYAVLLKGGHLDTDVLSNVYLDKKGLTYAYRSQRVHTNNTHGTGCTLSSAIAAYLALGETLPGAVELAGIYVNSALIAGQDVRTGKGKGPLNHFFAPVPSVKRKL